jgi:hypothetical protein
LSSHTLFMSGSTLRVDGVRFYLGAHHPHWLERAPFPLFVSHRRLAARRGLPRAARGWALDSGGFTELRLHGGWLTTPADYVAAVRRYREEIGGLEWAAPQDWMCEPFMLAKTGLTVSSVQLSAARGTPPPARAERARCPVRRGAA